MNALLAWAAAIVAAYYALRQSARNGSALSVPAATVPATTSAPAPGSAFQAAVASAASLTDLPPRFVVLVAVHETDDGRGNAFRRTLNAFSIHAVGAHNAYWRSDERNYTTANGEPLRGYATLTDSVQDFARLLRSKYPDARAAALRGDIPGAAAALERGGYSGKGYAARLMSSWPRVRV